MIYKWWISKKIKNKEIGCYDKASSQDRFLLYSCNFLDSSMLNSTPKVDFIIPKERVLTFDCLYSNANVPLVNQKVRTIIKNIAPEEIQFIDTEIICTDGTLTDTYFYMNVLNGIQGIDHEKSVYTKMKTGDEILSFEYLIYKENALNGFNIARDIEYTSNLLVSDKIKIAFDKEKINGVELIRPEDFNWSIRP